MPPELFHQPNACAGIKESLRDLYLSDPRPWLVGFSGGSPREMRLANHARRSLVPIISRAKDSTLVAALVFEAALAIPPAQRTKEIHVVCTDTRVEIPAVVEAIETTLARMRKCAAEHDLKLEVHLQRPPAEQSFWVNSITRRYMLPKRTFNPCAEHLRVNPAKNPAERLEGRCENARERSQCQWFQCIESHQTDRKCS